MLFGIAITYSGLRLIWPFRHNRWKVWARAGRRFSELPNENQMETGPAELEGKNTTGRKTAPLVATTVRDAWVQFSRPARSVPSVLEDDTHL